VNGRTLLNIATLMGSSGIVKMLLTRGAYISATDKKGRTALPIVMALEDDAVPSVLLLYLDPQTPQSVNSRN
jgi:ankyrin repeat protein